MGDENQVSSVEQTDNSSMENLQQEISAALDEPEATDEENTATYDVAKEPSKEEPKDNVQNECPEKFRKEDGSADVSKVLKSYKELEPLINEKAQWEKERAELLQAKQQLDEIHKAQEQTAIDAGYASTLDMQQSYEIAEIEANEYAKYLEYTDDPDEVRKMLITYSKYPSADLMKDIEMEFAPEVNKLVAIASERKKIEYENLAKQQQETYAMSKIEDVISKSVDENSEIFGYEPFKQLFLSAINKYRDNFTFDDAKALMNTMVQMRSLLQKEFETQHGTKIQNDKDTDKLAAISGTNSAPVASQNPNVDIDKLSASELAKEIRKYL